MDEKFLGEKEFLIQYSRRKESEKHRDYYVFGHRHMPLEIDLDERTRYFNLGEWVNNFSFGVFNGKTFELKYFSDEL